MSTSWMVQKGVGCRWCTHKGDRPHLRKRPYESLYNNFTTKAKHSVHITYEQFLSLTKYTNCHYCGEPILWAPYRKHDRVSMAHHLDRKDNTKDYHIENVVVACSRCNYAKGPHFTYEEWMQVGQVIRRFERPVPVSPD